MNKEFKNPLLAGLVNVLIPGISHLYVSRDWISFIGAFIINAFILVLAVAAGGIAQAAPRASLPQGVCTGILLTLVVVGMFAGGFNLARKNNDLIRAVL
jgi:hypothetical protein